MSKPVKVVPVEDSVDRVCLICQESKRLNTEFSYKLTYNCYSRTCKDCLNTRRRLKYHKKPVPEIYDILVKPIRPKRVSENKPYRKTTVANRKRLNYKCWDKKKGLENNLTIEFIEECLHSPCHYCGYPTSGLDRKDNALGHTIENCVPACYDCNTCRMDLFSYEEMLIMGKVMESIKDNRLPDVFLNKVKELVSF